MKGLEETVEAATASFVREKDRLAHGLATTPDERLDWAPSPTARTPVQIVAHAAAAVGYMTGNLEGRTFAVPTTAEADRGFREQDARCTAREQALCLLEKNGSAYLDWLQALTPERLESMVIMPFGLGSVPMGLAITFMADHLRWHSAQLDYIQTIYGDHDWHLL